MPRHRHVCGPWQIDPDQGADALFQVRISQSAARDNGADPASPSGGRRMSPALRMENHLSPSSSLVSIASSSPASAFGSAFSAFFSSLRCNFSSRFFCFFSSFWRFLNL